MKHEFREPKKRRNKRGEENRKIKDGKPGVEDTGKEKVGGCKGKPKSLE